MGKTLHIVFRLIVALHSVRLKLCSVKYLVHCSIITHKHTQKTIYIILGGCKTQPFNLVICPSIKINNISPLTRYLYKTLLVIAWGINGKSILLLYIITTKTLQDFFLEQ